MPKIKKLIRTSASRIRALRKIVTAPRIDYRRPLDPDCVQGRLELISAQDCEYAHQFRETFFSRFVADASTLRTSLLDVAVQVPGAVEQAVAEWETEYRVYGRVMPALSRQPPWRLPQRVTDDDILFAVYAHRFAFLPRLTLAVTDGRIPASEVVALLSDWCDFSAKRRSRSTAFVSSLLVIQRSLALVWAYAMLMAMDRRSDRGLAALLLKILKIDLEQISVELGNAAPNNHLLVDYFAGWFFGQIFDGTFTQQWGDRYENLFVEEFCRQVLPDGSGFENSTHYHEFDLEVGSMYVRLLRKTGRRESAGIRTRIQNMLEFKLAIWPIEFGNATEDPLFPLVNKNSIPISAWVSLASDLGVVHPSKCLVNDKAEDWYSTLMGKVDGGAESSADESFSAPKVFPNGGYISSYDERTGVNLVFRTAPSDRSRVIAGHSHADVLAVNLTENGRDVLVDPGTFTYRRASRSDSLSGGDWRSYFVGPLAHNNVTIDEEDPLGPISGDFRERLFRVEAEFAIVAADRSVEFMKCQLRATGTYDRVFRSVIHKIGEYFLVMDMVPPEIPWSQVKSTYQFSDRFDLKVLGDRTATLTDGADVWSLSVCDSAGNIEHWKGCEDPIAGWISPQYGSRIPASQFRVPFRSSRLMAAVISRGATGMGIRAQTEGSSGDTIRVEVTSPDSGEDRFLVAAGVGLKMFKEAPTKEGGHLWYSIDDNRITKVI